jgi:hypothetical protein
MSRFLGTLCRTRIRQEGSGDSIKIKTTTMDTILEKAIVPGVGTTNQPIGCINFRDTIMICDCNGEKLMATGEDGFAVWMDPGFRIHTDNHKLYSDSSEMEESEWDSSDSDKTVTEDDTTEDDTKMEEEETKKEEKESKKSEEIPTIGEDGFIVWSSPRSARRAIAKVMRSKISDSRDSESEFETGEEENETKKEDEETETETEDETLYYLPYNGVGLGSGEV